MLAGGSASVAVADSTTVAVVAAVAAAVLGALVGGVFTLIAASMNNRAAAERERRARVAERQQVFASTFVVVAVITVGVVVGFHNQLFGKEDTTTAASAPVAPSTVSPSVDALPPVQTATPSASSPSADATQPPAATCPSAADLDAAHLASLDDKGQYGFNVAIAPPDGTTMVLQLRAHTKGRENHFSVSICRDSSGSYWYFSRLLSDKVVVGLVTAATPTATTFEARNGNTLYSFSGTDGFAKGPGVDFDYVVEEILCAAPSDVPEGFVTPAKPGVHRRRDRELWDDLSGASGDRTVVARGNAATTRWIGFWR